jgi:hypothetical protein
MQTSRAKDEPGAGRGLWNQSRASAPLRDHLRRMLSLTVFVSTAGSLTLSSKDLTMLWKLQEFH